VFVPLPGPPTSLLRRVFVIDAADRLLTGVED
jgi:hypothetical protein